ncbi:MAG: cupin domain-containing protein [Deltaproteobacteria bacterium]|nr:cupin domain-containing protein [Deltaproteobacteria bacterium]
MSLDEFNRELREKNLIGYWMIPIRSDDFREPQASFEPFLWKWAEIYEALQKAVNHIAPEDAWRRFIGFQHPALKLGTCHTLLMGAQMIRPGEKAPAHRHTMEAIRFVVQGRGVYTTVEGEAFPMDEGDLITTPNWTWHDHVSTGEGTVIWLDGANGPMIQYFQTGFAELYHHAHQTITRPDGCSEHEYGFTRSVGTTPATRTFRPPYRYRWEETRRALELKSETPGDPYDGVLLRYVDPATGAPTLPSMSCEIQMLRPREQTRSHRHTHTVIYHAFRGSGSTMIHGQRFDWEHGDSFVVPLWTWHSHANNSPEPAILFSINDRPALEALGLHREETKKDADTTSQS